LAKGWCTRHEKKKKKGITIHPCFALEWLPQQRFYTYLLFL
jgi:hypothetical protein